jgi:glycosyltransferase involved in cell wall biosynthesis
MKILFLCKKFPYPLKDGESIAVSNLCKELKNMGCELTLLSMNTRKHYSDTSALPPDYNYFKEILTVDIDNSIKPWEALTSLLSGESYHVRRFRSEEFTEKLIALLKKETFDIVQLETLYLAPYVETIRKYSKAKVVMRAHNVEHEIWERITRNTGSYLRKLYLAYLTRKLRQYELDQFPAYDYLITLTERDLKQFVAKGYINCASSAPIGFDINTYPYQRPAFGPQMSICFIGSLDWMPNAEGLDWFLQNCWPDIHTLWPDLTLHVAGRNTPATMLDLKMPGVKIHGEVPDAAEFINQHSIMIVPLFSGSGMRVKIVEGMMMGKVIISTSVGKEGIDGNDREHFLMAEDKAQFIQAIQYCVESPDKALAIGLNAQKNAEHQFDSSNAAQKIMDIYQSLLGNQKLSIRNFPEPTLTP